MRMKKGELWRCTDPVCAAEIVVVQSGSNEGFQNPRCACGSELKRLYEKPIVRQAKGSALKDLKFLTPVKTR